VKARDFHVWSLPYLPGRYIRSHFYHV
jgi:hypothetical protein